MEPCCPICSQRADASRANPYRPFCSRRCQLVDLSRWLDEDYAIPGEPADIPDGRDESERER